MPISTRWGSVILTLYTDRHTPSGEPAPLDGSTLASSAARLAGGLLARDRTSIRTAAGELMHSAADIVAHLHIGLHWRPTKPDATPEPTPAPGPAAPEKTVAGGAAGG